MSVPAIMLKKLLGNNYSTVSHIEKTYRVAIHYHKAYLTDECYPMEMNCKLLIKGDKNNISKAYEELKEKLEQI